MRFRKLYAAAAVVAVTVGYGALAAGPALADPAPVVGPTVPVVAPAVAVPVVAPAAPAAPVPAVAPAPAAAPVAVAPAVAPAPSAVAPGPNLPPQVPAELPSTAAQTVIAGSGADMSYEVFDRATGKVVAASGANTPRMTASVVKVMIADQVLTLRNQGKLKLSNAELSRLRLMITRSDDGAADVFWKRGGGNAIVTAVAQRYHLVNTSPPNGAWWFTMTSPADLVSLYSQILSGVSTPPNIRMFITGAMRGFQKTGTDGTNQTFGLPSTVHRGGFKQGWMELANGSWVHNTTGFFGPGDRYVAAVMHTQPQAKPEAAATGELTSVTRALLPGGVPGPA
jgi:hypothetical protein